MFRALCTIYHVLMCAIFLICVISVIQGWFFNDPPGSLKKPAFSCLTCYVPQMDGPLSNPEDPPGDGDTGLLDLPEVTLHPSPAL